MLRRLGLEKPEDLVGFQFAKLRKELFSFWLPTIEGGVPEGGEGARSAEIGRGTLQLKVFRESGVYGIDLYEKAWRERQAETRRKLRKMDLELLERPRQRSRKNGNLVAYDDFNRRTEKALRRLGKAWLRVRAR